MLNRSGAAKDAPTKRAEPAGAERRRETRYALSEPVTVTLGGVRHDCSMSDNSTGGAMIEGDLPVEAGTKVRVDFADFADVTARVVYVGDGFFGTQFIDAARHRDAIRAWIFERTAQSSKAASDT